MLTVVKHLSLNSHVRRLTLVKFLNLLPLTSHLWSGGDGALYNWQNWMGGSAQNSAWCIVAVYIVLILWFTMIIIVIDSELPLPLEPHFCCHFLSSGARENHFSRLPPAGWKHTSHRQSWGSCCLWMLQKIVGVSEKYTWQAIFVLCLSVSLFCILMSGHTCFSYLNFSTPAHSLCHFHMGNPQVEMTLKGKVRSLALTTNPLCMRFHFTYITTTFPPPCLTDGENESQRDALTDGPYIAKNQQGLDSNSSLSHSRASPHFFTDTRQPA